mgnify:CR=1 FL=1
MGIRGDRVASRVRPDPRAIRAGVVLAVAVLVPVTLALAEQAGRRPIKTELEETVEIRLREIPIVAVRGELEGVTDLRPEGLEVRVGGEPVPVQFLDRDLDRGRTDGPPPAARLFVKIGEEFQTVAPQAEPPRHFLLMVDVENSSRRREEASREAIVRSLYRVSVIPRRSPSRSRSGSRINTS